MSSIVRRYGLLVVCAATVATAVGVVAQGQVGPGRGRLKAGVNPSVQLTLAHRAKLENKAQSLAERAFDDPDLAAEFYVNKRTGPINTRGANITTGARPLSPAAYLPALQQMRAMSRYSSAMGAVLPSHDDAPDINAAPGAALQSWSNVGPGNQGGRTRALLIHPTTPTTMYAGGVAGGVWRSTDAGANWLALADLQMSNLAVSSLAFDPQNANTIYAGTGEGFFNFDAIRGAGIFRSTDAGLTWNQIAATNNANFHYTMSVVVSPRDSQRIFAATRTGVFRSIDGGAIWTSLINGVPVNGCTQLALQVNGAAGFVFAACGTFAQGTIQRANDDNVSTFSSVLSLAGMGRSSIAVAPSNESVVYVMASQATAGGGVGVYGLHGVYRSTSNGDLGSFSTQVNGTVAPVGATQRLNQALLSNPVYAFLADCGFGSTAFLNQGWYDNVIAVDPLDQNRVWAGGVDLFRSDDGGANWGAAGYWWFDKGIDPQYHHADQHGIVFHPQYNGTTNRVMFSASDGGIERIDDARAPVNTTLAQICGTPLAGSPTWVDRNNGYVTTQFYDGAVYPNGQTFFGGLQDNGTQRGTTSGLNWTILTGGDGGYVAVDTLADANAANDVLFAEYTGNSLQKSTNGGATFAAANSGITGAGFLFIAPFAMNQGSKQHIWTGGFDIWRSTNQAGAWARATGANATCGAGSISAIAAHPLDGNRVLVGKSDGCYHYNHAALTAPNTGSWLGGGSIASAFISSMTWDPANINVAYATVSRFGAANLYKTVDGGVSWLPSVGSGITSLPQIPALSVVVHPTDSLQVFVGTDLGVFTSVDGGVSWYLENTGFSNVPVEALEFNETAPYRLSAFTHGRGAWQVSLTPDAALPVATSDSYNTAFNTVLNVVAPGVLVNDNANGGGAMTAVLDTTVSAGAGTLVLNANGGFTFTPTTGFTGPASFTYHASNANGSSAIVTATITVAAAPLTPVAVDDAYTTAFNTPIAVAAPGVLGNDNANGGGAMSAPLASGASNGTVSLIADGSFTYTPAAGFSGPATFTYRASTPAGGQSAIATVTITVAAPPAPIVVNDAYATPHNTPLIVPAPGVLANDNANGGGAMSATLASGASNGTVSLIADGSFTYAPNLGFSGGDSFTYRASPAGSGNVATVTVSVGAPIVGPVPPTNFRVVLIVGNDVTFAWTPPLSGTAPTGFQLEGGIVPGQVLGALPLGVTSAVTLALPSGSFFLRVRTLSGGTTSAASNEVLTHVNVPLPPSPPANLLALVVGTTVNLAWTPTLLGGAPTTTILEVTGSLSGSLPLGPTDTFAFAGVPAGTYTFTVRASNASGMSAPSTPVTLTFPGACSGAPQTVANFLTYKNGSTLFLNWDPPTSGVAPTGYVLTVTAPPVFVGSIPTTQRALSGAVPPGTYHLSVVSTNPCGASAPTAVQTVTVP